MRSKETMALWPAMIQQRVKETLKSRSYSTQLMEMDAPGANRWMCGECNKLHCDWWTMSLYYFGKMNTVPPKLETVNDWLKQPLTGNILFRTLDHAPVEFGKTKKGNPKRYEHLFQHFPKPGFRGQTKEQQQALDELHQRLHVIFSDSNRPQDCIKSWQLPDKHGKEITTSMLYRGTLKWTPHEYPKRTWKALYAMPMLRWVRTHVWKCWNNGLFTKNRKHGIGVDTLCGYCDDEEENGQHVIHDCRIHWIAKNLSEQWRQIQITQAQIIMQPVEWQAQIEVAVIMYWTIHNVLWQWRNMQEKKDKKPMKTHTRILSLAVERMAGFYDWTMGTRQQEYGNIQKVQILLEPVLNSYRIS